MMRKWPDAWLQTFTGRQFWPLEPDPGDVDIEDIAHALSNLCRFGGHSRRFYSVAEHSVHVGDVTGGLYGLLHDAAEAYVVDLPRPLKLEMPDYQRIEDRVLDAIYAGLGLLPPFPDVQRAVKRADNAVLASEKLVLHPNGRKWSLDEEPARGVVIECLSPKEAELLFLLEWERLRQTTGRAM